MKNIKKSKNEEMHKKWEKMKNKKQEKRQKKREKKKVGKKEKEFPKGITRDGPKNWFFT